MTEPLSWTWVLQIVVLLLFLGLILSLLLLLAQRKRPAQFHVFTYEKNATWEEVKAQIEENNPIKPQWKYTDVAKDRGFTEEGE